MYIPPAFAVTDHDTLFDLIEQNSFGLLVSQRNGEPFATHLPLLVDRCSAPSGKLIGHMARANPHWKDIAGSVLAIFSGPHAYISPTWYESDNVVPTWNYVAVHVYGTLRVIDDRAATLQILGDYVSFYEAAMPSPWKADDTFVAKLAEQVVPFEVEIARIEGKWKLNQNHPRARREKVINALASRPDENSRAIAALMASSIGAE